MYGLGAGVWSRNGNVAYRIGRAITAGRVWTNCYHAYPAHAAFLDKPLAARSDFETGSYIKIRSELGAGCPMRCLNKMPSPTK